MNVANVTKLKIAEARRLLEKIINYSKNVQGIILKDKIMIFNPKLRKMVANFFKLREDIDQLISENYIEITGEKFVKQTIPQKVKIEIKKYNDYVNSVDAEKNELTYVLCHDNEISIQKLIEKVRNLKDAEMEEKI